ncbi:MAG: inorganic phosphate transporter [Lewinellaceae bacterium]|nr:inorganic phosphate transporter [Phaeodactylibacter sp.]MCB0615154.1 inorganic phosphate transporter [Phaeodactylibacter sp.]MCB9347966.1 inorganic phosphate transporter [Lewinellaceae bacterium]
MPEYYLIIVILLFTLAISDLIVGVSNDAVNFLNSAIGSKVASRHAIMIVASLGIFVGATFSNGMMEVARKGIFNPEFFVFAEVMVIFLAVMLTDIILLDLFNTFGMPTSTTISIVFELLGASVAVSLLKIAAAGDSFSALGQYINSSSALAIISGIFISVGIAFVVGTFLQYLSRLLFTFQYERRMDWVGSLWAGLALTFLTYFLLIKGIKGASFVPDAFVSWVKDNTMLLIVISLVFWSIAMQVILMIFKVNILRIVVLFGTFSLAMAFAGNDLVNFIGVPIAGFESFNAWSASGAGAEDFGMAVLGHPVRTNTLLLLLAGIVMILTLWFSKKAQSVTETEVNLGRQEEGSERFLPNALSRGIVRYTRQISMGVQKLVPESWLEKAEDSFKPVEEVVKKEGEHDPAAFDLVRASVNLTVASMLIAFATSLKLPLSTTYVSFMVAMGTSLADRAWGRDSAVYRVAGVLNVIAGWFLTAFIAFSVSALFALAIYSFGGWAIGILVILAVFLISRTFLFHKRREKEKAEEESFERQAEMIPAFQVLKETSSGIKQTLSGIRTALHDSLFGLLQEDQLLLERAEQAIHQLEKGNKSLKKKLFSAIRRIEEKNAEASRAYLLVYDLEQDILQSIKLIFHSCFEHVENVHKPLDNEQGELLYKMQEEVSSYLQDIEEVLGNGAYHAIDTVLEEKRNLFLELEGLINHQVEGVKKRKYGRRNSMLYFSLLLELKDLIAVAARFVKLYSRVQQSVVEGEMSLMAGK